MKLTSEDQKCFQELIKSPNGLPGELLSKFVIWILQRELRGSSPAFFNELSGGGYYFRRQGSGSPPTLKLQIKITTTNKRAPIIYGSHFKPEAAFGVLRIHGGSGAVIGGDKFLRDLVINVSSNGHYRITSMVVWLNVKNFAIFEKEMGGLLEVIRVIIGEEPEKCIVVELSESNVLAYRAG